MPVTSASVIIPHPPATVWEYCRQPEHVATFLPGVEEIEDDGVPVAVGTRWRGKNKILGKTFDWVGTYSRVEEGKGTEFTTTPESSLQYTIWTEYEEVDDGTHYTYRIESAPGLGGIFGKLADSVVSRVY